MLHTPEIRPVEMPRQSKDFVNVRVRDQKLFSEMGFYANPFELTVGKVTYGNPDNGLKSLYVQDSPINRIAYDIPQLEDLMVQIESGLKVFQGLNESEQNSLYQEYSHSRSVGRKWKFKHLTSVNCDDTETLERYLQQRWYADMFELGKKQSELTKITELTRPKKSDWNTITKDSHDHTIYNKVETSITATGKSKTPKVFNVASFMIGVPGGKYPYFITEEEQNLEMDEIKEKILDLDESTDASLALAKKDNGKFLTYYNVYKSGRLSDRVNIQVQDFSKYEPFFNQRFLKEMVMSLQEKGG